MQIHEGVRTVWIALPLAALAAWNGCPSDVQRGALAAAGPAVCATSLFARAQQRPADPLEARVRALGDALIRDGRAQGLAIALRSGASETLSLALGRLEADEHGRVEAPALVEPLLAIAALQCVERGELALDAPLDAPAGSDSQPAEAARSSGAPPRLRELLAHSSGLASIGDALRADARAATLPLAELAARCAALPRANDAGECFHYSDADGLWIVRELEALAHAPAADWIAERVLAPAGLGAECLRAPEAQRERWSEGVQFAAGQAHPSYAGALLGGRIPALDARELAALVAALPAGELLGAGGFAQLCAPAERSRAAPSGFAHGVSLTSVGGQRGFALGGADARHALYAVSYPDAGLTIALLAAGPDVPLFELERRIARQIFGLPEPELLDLPLDSAQRALYAGVYYVGCSRYSIRSVDEQLWLEPPIGLDQRLAYQGQHVFVAALDRELRLSFHLEGERAADYFVLDEHGVESVARRGPGNPAQKGVH